MRFRRRSYPFAAIVFLAVGIALVLLGFYSLAHASCYRCEHRSSEAKHEFEVVTGHPHGWRGHVVDHVIPLACGGEDSPRNMQWQTIAEGKAKDRWERNCPIWGGRTYPSMPVTPAVSR